jgi:peptidoglycan/xylan/chitin deacetylase (PgdA/CDA1 family)
MIRLLTTAAITLAVSIASAAPITTVPWNGKTGAVSFTYDDARTSQIPNLIPQLDSLGIKATFFISIQNIGDFNARRAAWIQASRKGHELTNHTYAHANVNGSDGAAVTTMIKTMADTLRAVDPSIQSVTFAYPNCNLTTNATAKNGIDAENFMARGCANPTLNWGTQPTDWMNIQGEILGPTSASTAVTRINTAKTNNRWYITILHDVGENPDQYSMTPANNLTMLTAAVSAGVWIDTYSTIGAYYRAHFTVDTAKAVAQGTGSWKIQWVSPHAKMPKSVPLRVKLDSTVALGLVWVTQGDTTITRQPDGTYVIDFMKLQLTVNSGVSVSPALLLRHAALHARITGKRLDLSGLPQGEYVVGLHDASGRMVQKRNIRSAGTREQAFYFAAAPSNGLYQLTVRQSASGPARTVPLLILK